MFYDSKSSTSPISLSSSHSFVMLMLSIVALFMTDTLLEMASISSMAVSIGMVGGAGDMNEKGGIAGTIGAATVDSWSLGIGEVASLTLLPFLHGRGVSFKAVVGKNSWHSKRKIYSTFTLRSIYCIFGVYLIKKLKFTP